MNCLEHSGKASRNVLLMLLLFVSASAVAFAQGVPPLVYDVENTGASFAAPVFPDFAHAPINRALPDPFVFFSDGRRDTSFGSWEERRNEIKAAIEAYELGPKPDCSDCTITATYTPATAPTRGTLSIQVTRTVNGSPVTITMNTRCFVPAGTPPAGGYPVNVPMAGSAGASNLGTGSLGAGAFSGVAMASCDFPHNTATTYGGPRRTDNFYRLYPQYCAGAAAASGCTAANGFPDGTNHGQYAAWSWGVSRIIDGMKIASQQATNPLPVNLSRIMVTGCSYAGKMAMFAGAFDERIALTIAQENGGGGAPSWRANRQIEPDDKVENLDHTDTNWFASKMWKYQGDNVYKLPHDHHELQAMVAPRAMLETGNTDFLWLSDRANTVSSRATAKVYEAFGISDRYGFYLDGGHGHCSVPAAQTPVLNRWIKKYMAGDTTQDTNTRVTPYPSMDTARWTDSWGTADQGLSRDWNPGVLLGPTGTPAVGSPTASVSLSMPAAVPINFGETLSAGYALNMPGSHPAATATLNGDIYKGSRVEADVTCPDGTSYTLTASFPKQSYTIAANDSTWYPVTNLDQGSVPNDNANSSNTACNGGVITNVTFSALGTQTTRGAGNAGGPGFSTTDTADPLYVRYSIGNGANESTSGPTPIFYAANINGTQQLTTTAALSKLGDGSYQAVVTVKNSGTGTAQFVKLTSATLGAAGGATIPQTLGAIQPGASANVTVNFPASAGNSGSASVLKLVGSYAPGSFGATVRVVLP